MQNPTNAGGHYTVSLSTAKRVRKLQPHTGTADWNRNSTVELLPFARCWMQHACPKIIALPDLQMSDLPPAIVKTFAPELLHRLPRIRKAVVEQKAALTQATLTSTSGSYP